MGQVAGCRHRRKQDDRNTSANSTNSPTGLAPVVGKYHPASIDRGEDGECDGGGGQRCLAGDWPENDRKEMEMLLGVTTSPTAIATDRGEDEECDVGGGRQCLASDWPENGCKGMEMLMGVTTSLTTIAAMMMVTVSKSQP